MSLSFIDLFAGIGGFRYGMELAGHTCKGFCEFDKFAVAGYTSMHLLAERQRDELKKLDLRKRQKEILKDEYRKGEWYAKDITKVDASSMPSADCWCFGFPCQDISIAGNRSGFRGNRSSLFFAVTKLVRELKEEDKPRYLFIENVKNLFSINRGFDFARVLIELDEIGYDAKWMLLNSKNFGIPQNRERIFIIANLRSKSGQEVLPVAGKNVKAPEAIIVNQGNFCSKEESAPVTDQGNEMKDEKDRCFIDQSYINPKITSYARCLTTNYNSGIGKRCIKSGVIEREVFQIPIHDGTEQGYALACPGDAISLAYPGNTTRRGRVKKSLSPTLDTGCQIGTLLRNGRIRRLTPRECFRLQGWSDDYFEKAAFVNSDSQLYKQAGNQVTINVIQAIAENYL